jgi:hypothetical protein
LCWIQSRDRLHQAIAIWSSICRSIQIQSPDRPTKGRSGVIIQQDADLLGPNGRFSAERQNATTTKLPFSFTHKYPFSTTDGWFPLQSPLEHPVSRGNSSFSSPVADILLRHWKTASTELRFANSLHSLPWQHILVGMKSFYNSKTPFGVYVGIAVNGGIYCTFLRDHPRRTSLFL